MSYSWLPTRNFERLEKLFIRMHPLDWIHVRSPEFRKLTTLGTGP
jgi:hypothetical protein